MGLGRLGVCPCGRAGQLTVSREACLSRVVGLSGAGMRDTPAAALLGGGGCPRVLVCDLGVACCRGSGAVRPGCLTRLGLLICWGLWVGVGGLVVNCIVDASILL